MSVVGKDPKAHAPRGRYSAGAMEYRDMGYWQPDYEPKDTDIITCFRVTPQEGVDPIEASAAVAGSLRRRPGLSFGLTPHRQRQISW